MNFTDERRKEGMKEDYRYSYDHTASPSSLHLYRPPPPLPLPSATSRYSSTPLLLLSDGASSGPAAPRSRSPPHLRVGRPDSVDTDSSADSGIQTTVDRRVPAPLPLKQRYVRPLDPTHPPPPQTQIIYRHSNEQRPSSAAEEFLRQQQRIAAASSRPMAAAAGGGGGGGRGLGRELSGVRLNDAPRIRSLYDDASETGSFGRLKGETTTNGQRNSSDRIMTAAAAAADDWIESRQFSGRDVRIGGGGGVVIRSPPPSMDQRNGAMESSANVEKWIRGEFLKRRSNSNDSGYNDRPPAPHSTDRPPPTDSTHQPPSALHAAPSAGTPKKPSTPNRIRRQLRTITESVVLQRKSKSMNAKTERRSGQVEEDEDEEGVRWSSSGDRGRRWVVGPSASQTPDRRISSSPLSTTTESSSGSKKSKPIVSRLWPKQRVAELKSAPSSPETARKARSQELLMENLVAVKTPTNILELTEEERSSLQKIAIEHLLQLGIGPVTIPKSHSERRKTLKGIFQRRNGNQNAGDSTHSSTRNAGGGGGGGDVEKERSSTKPLHWTFGISLESCISNDVILGRLTGSARDGVKGQSGDGGNARLLDALTLSVGSPASKPRSVLQVPYVVLACCSYLRENALTVKGLFRVGGLKSRVNQLRREFDSGSGVCLLPQVHSPHDVASLLKEFLRDLPQCLLTRDLFQAFVATASLKSQEERLKALRLLISLLPVANRDTLWTLLSLLTDVVEHSTERITQNGIESSGNRMDSSNLATIFGPSILHRFKPGKSQLDSSDQLSQYHDVIAVVKEMIDSFHLIFKLHEGIHREILHALMEKNPDGADYILCHHDNSNHHHSNNDYHSCQSGVWSNESLTIQLTPSHPQMTPSRGHRTNATTCLSPGGTQVSAGQSPHQNSRHELLKVRGTKRALNCSDFHQKTDASVVNGDAHLCLNGSYSNDDDDPSTVSALIASKAAAAAAAHSTEGSSSSSSSSSVVDGPGPSAAKDAGSWERQRWRYWEQLTKICSEEFHEPQTLV